MRHAIQAGQFCSAASGETLSGVLISEAGKQIALVTWADKDWRRLPRLYGRVRAALAVGGIDAVRADSAVRVN